MREWFRFDKFLSDQLISDTDIERALKFTLPLPGFQQLLLFDGLVETEMQVADIKNKVKRHARMVRVVKGDKLFEEGTYTNTVFYIVDGAASVRRAKKSAGFFARFLSGKQDQDDDDEEATVVEKGHLIGLPCTLDRVRQVADIVAESDMVLLEIRWQLLYQIICSSRNFSNYVDYNFRQQTLYYYLRGQPWFKNISSRDLRLITDNADFQNFGTSNWFRAEQESEVIVEQGAPVDKFVIVWAGFARVVNQTHHGHELLRMMRRHSTFGMLETYCAMQESQEEQSQTWQTGVLSLGYTKIITIPPKMIYELVIPNIPKKELQRIIADRRNQKLSFTNGNEEIEGLNLERSFQAGALDFIQEGAFLNGNHGMIINLDRCVRCFDCVSACSDLHNGQAVFSWHGKRFDNFQISNACMHCVDPVCMVECPTGAITRTGEVEDVQINPDTCIGCGACAEACPYNNIKMMDIMKRKGGGEPGEVEVERQVATKCDLCAAENYGPACEGACPHEALLRVNMMDMKSITKWIKR